MAQWRWAGSKRFTFHRGKNRRRGKRRQTAEGNRFDVPFRFIANARSSRDLCARPWKLTPNNGVRVAARATYPPISNLYRHNCAGARRTERKPRADPAGCRRFRPNWSPWSPAGYNQRAFTFSESACNCVYRCRTRRGRSVPPFFGSRRFSRSTKPPRRSLALQFKFFTAFESPRRSNQRLIKG